MAKSGLQDLTFQLLDDLMLGVQRGRLAAESFLPSLNVNDLGPLVELFLYARSNEPLISTLEDLLLICTEF